MVEFFVNEPGTFFRFHVYSDPMPTHVYEDGAGLEPGLDPGQWVQAHVTRTIIVEGAYLENYNLWVSVEYETDNKPGIGLDTTMFSTYMNFDPERWFRLYSNSFKGIPGAVITNSARVPGDLMIRVQAENLDVLAKKEVVTTTAVQTVSVQPSGVGLGFAVIAIGAGAAAAAGGLAVALSSRAQSEVYILSGHYYCRRHRVPAWLVDSRPWCPVEGRFLKP